MEKNQKVLPGEGSVLILLQMIMSKGFFSFYFTFCLFVLVYEVPLSYRNTDNLNSVILVCLYSQVGCFLRTLTMVQNRLTNHSVTVSCSGSGSPELKKTVVKLFVSLMTLV